MKKLLKFVLWIILVLALIIFIAGFVFIKTFDLNKYKSYVEEIVYNQTGRKLSLKGEAGLKISLVPTVVLKDVSFENASWATEPDMIKAKSAEVSVSIIPLLHKEIVIDTVNLIDPEVYLSVNVDGVANWEFAKPLEETDSDIERGLNESSSEETTMSGKNDGTQDVSEAQSGIESASPLLAGFVAKRISIENAKLVYTDMQSGSVADLQIKSLIVRSEDMDSNVNLIFDVVYNGEDVSGTVTAGSINSILQQTEKYPVKADIKAFGVAVAFDAVLTNLMTDLSFDGSFQLQNPAGNFGAPSVALTAEFSGTPKDIVLELNSLNIAENVLRGKVSIDLNGAQAYIEAVLDSDAVNLQTLTASPVKTAAAFTLVPSAAAAEFVPDTALDLAVLHNINAKLQVSIASLVVNSDLSLNNISLTAVLQNGSLSVAPLELYAGGGVVKGDLSIKAANNAFSISLTGDDIVLQDLWKGLMADDSGRFAILSGGKTTISVQLTGQGKTLRQMVESLNGQVIAIVGESEIQTGALKYLTENFVTQLLKALNIDKQQKNLQLSCAVVRSDITSGKASFPKGVVFNSEQLMVVSDGTLNLENDKLDFTIHPFNGKLVDANVMQALSSLVKVGGTVESPKIELDNSAVIKNVVGVAAAGPAFLGSQLVLDADESPCYTALKGTTYQNMFPAPEGVKAAGQGVYQGTSEVISDGVNVLTNTAKDVLNLFKRKD